VRSSLAGTVGLMNEGAGGGSEHGSAGGGKDDAPEVAWEPTSGARERRGVPAGTSRYNLEGAVGAKSTSVECGPSASAGARATRHRAVCGAGARSKASGASKRVDRASPAGSGVRAATAPPAPSPTCFWLVGVVDSNSARHSLIRDFLQKRTGADGMPRAIFTCAPCLTITHPHKCVRLRGKNSGGRTSRLPERACQSTPWIVPLGFSLAFEVRVTRACHGLRDAARHLRLTGDGR